MLAKVISGAAVGLKCVPVTVEVDIASKSLPSFTVVGLPNKAVEESKERVRAAIKNSGGQFPVHRITVNLAPANLPKEGPAYDLPIAVGILIASGQIPDNFSKSILYGELSLDGSLRHTNGILPMALLAKEKNSPGLFVPAINAQEARLIKGIVIYPVKNLMELTLHAAGRTRINRITKTNNIHSFNERTVEYDFADIKGQAHAKRALEVVAAGGHNIHLRGSPGAGKTMLSRALPGILPEMSEEEMIEVTKIYSISGNLPDGYSLITQRPFRAPHHTTSRIGLIGGGTRPIPGEISLAHRGALFLDEFPEFPRNVLEALRQPLEDGIISISRAAATVLFPAKFTLIAASNPCPCGYFGEHDRECICTQVQIIKYQKRISGPITDRIDMHVTMPAVPAHKLIQKENSTSETSSTIRTRVEKARNIQRERFREERIFTNAEMNTKQVKKYCPMAQDAEDLLTAAIKKLNLSARTYFKMIKIGRTIADLSNNKIIESTHIGEALQYRPKGENI